MMKIAFVLVCLPVEVLRAESFTSEIINSGNYFRFLFSNAIYQTRVSLLKICLFLEGRLHNKAIHHALKSL